MHRHAPSRAPPPGVTRIHQQASIVGADPATASSVTAFVQHSREGGRVLRRQSDGAALRCLRLLRRGSARQVRGPARSPRDVWIARFASAGRVLRHACDRAPRSNPPEKRSWVAPGHQHTDEERVAFWAAGRALARKSRSSSGPITRSAAGRRRPTRLDRLGRFAATPAATSNLPRLLLEARAR